MTSIPHRFLFIISILFNQLVISDMQLLRSDDDVRFQHLHATTDASSSGRLKQEMAKAFNITAAAPQSIVSEIVRCLRCTKSVVLAIRAALVSGNHFERFVNTCNRLRGVIECTNRVPGKCSKETGIKSLLGSFRHFCINQFSAFKYIFECLDLHATEVLRECQEKCKATRRVLGWFLYSFIHSTLPFTVSEAEVPTKINAKYFNKMSGGACSILSCYVNCLREKYNMRCNDIGGNIPLISLHKSWPYSPIATATLLIMPQTCDFFTTLEQLNGYRMDEKIYTKINKAFPSDAKDQYANHLQDRNFSAISWIPLLKSLPFAMDHEELPNDPEKDSAPPIHIEEVEEAIEEFKVIDRLQQLKP
ncbi:unnamed protein product [Litomosoides sigmodontis]|uniref:Chondroitin proteoglycan 4 domain-containing protein n=1 Tax=Litomosoides sigmodontis TaxID=42156 RepID=A0A3P6UCP2_LITSI|nr:unnamed protein product [Litomosoides sigmodontis]